MRMGYKVKWWRVIGEFVVLMVGTLFIAFALTEDILVPSVNRLWVCLVGCVLVVTSAHGYFMEWERIQVWKERPLGECEKCHKDHHLLLFDYKTGLYVCGRCIIARMFRSLIRRKEC